MVQRKKKEIPLNRNNKAGTKRNSSNVSEVPTKKAKNVPSKEVARKSVGNDKKVRKSVLAGRKVKKTPDEVEVSPGKVEKTPKKGSPAQKGSAQKRKVTPKVWLC